MWQIVLVSLILFGVHQLIPRQEAKSASQLPVPATGSTATIPPTSHNPRPTSRPLIMKAIESLTLPPADEFYTFTDPSSNKEYKIPKLGDCSPHDGYKRFLNPATGKPAFANEGPIQFRIYNVTLPNHGFTWKGASTDLDVLDRINKSVIANSIRAEFNQKLEHLVRNTVTKFDWTSLKNKSTRMWPTWPLDTTSRAYAWLSVSIGRTLYAFQLVIKCGDFSLYTDQVHWLEMRNGQCDGGIQVFATCKTCWDIRVQCPILIED